MRFKLGVIILTLILLSAASGIRTDIHAQTSVAVKIGIDTGHNNLHTSQAELQDFTSIIITNGGAVEYSNTPLNQTYLNSVDLLLISSPTINYTSNELTALDTWYVSGGNIWLSASPENITAVTSLNQILQNLNSSLRLENAYVVDPIFNLNSTSGDSANLLAPVINHGQESGLLTEDIRVLYAHTPVPILGFNPPNFAKLSSAIQYNAKPIAATAGSAQINNISATQPLRVYSPGEAASVPIAVGERTGKSSLALTGFPVFSLWKKEISYLEQRPYDNRLLVRNLLRWLTPMLINSEIEMSFPLVRARGKLLVSIDNGTSNQHVSEREIKPFQNLLSGLGIDSRVFISYSPTIVGNATVIVIQAPHRILNPDESAAIINWFAEGNKTLILASTADYSLDGNATESQGLNTILLDLHSNLRFEQAAVYDPQVNVGGTSYLALSSIINHESPDVANFTKNIRSLFFQFGTILDGRNQTGPIPLESNLSSPQFQNITWISRTSNISYLEHLSRTYPMLAHKSGESGSFITSAIERLGTNRIITLGGPIFTNFDQLLTYPTIYNQPVDNLLFIRNIFTQRLNQRVISTGMNATAYPTKITRGGTVRFSASYSARFGRVSNLSGVLNVQVPTANLTLTFNGVTVNLTRLSNGTYTTTATADSPGSLAWSLAASAQNYQSQSLSNSIQVTAPPKSFTWYVLSIPIVIFLAVAIAVTARKAR